MSAQVKPDNKAPLLEIRGLTKEFRQGKDRVLAVNHIDLDIQKGEVFGLVGESGCGKSTFGQMLVHLLDPSGGQVKDFLMNDKCAAGTGRFLEMTMSRVGSDITSIDTFVEGAEPVTINSMCAVFAESEIIGLLAQETPPGSIALGCIYSICRRTAIFAQKLAPENPKVFFSGGLAQSQVVREVLARYLGVESVTAHPLCQYNGAIGAAVLGWKRVNR